MDPWWWSYSAPFMAETQMICEAEAIKEGEGGGGGRGWEEGGEGKRELPRKGQQTLSRPF